MSDFWKEDTTSLRLGEVYPPVGLKLSMIDIAKVNSLEPVVKHVILSDGKELDVHILLDTDRDVFARDLRGVLNEEAKNSG